MVIRRVDRSAAQRPVSVNDQFFRLCFRRSAQSPDHRRGGFDAVAFLQAQTPGVAENRPALRGTGHYRQYRQQVRGRIDIDQRAVQGRMVRSCR